MNSLTALGRKTVVFYVSGHGLGHSARSLGVVNCIPDDIDVIVCTQSPRWFWEGERTRRVVFREVSLDVAPIQVDTLQTDGARSIRALLQHHKNRAERLKEEVRFLKDVGADLVVSDVASLPLAAAELTLIPGCFLGNFTWVDIFTPFLKTLIEYPELETLARGTLALMAEDYAKATQVFITPLNMDMPVFDGLPVFHVPHVCRETRDIEADFRHTFGLSKNDKIVLVSGGLYGVEFDFSLFRCFEGVRFFSFNSPEEAAPYLTQLPFPRWRSQDVTAIAYAVVAKAGYGTLAECMTLGTPLIYPPREGFAEQAVLVSEMAKWGGGVPLEKQAYLGLDLADAFRILRERPPLELAPSGGSEWVAEALLEHLKN